MFKFKTLHLTIFFTLIAFSFITLFHSKVFASSAKQKYLVADSYYKKLRNSTSKKKKETEWLKCINRYEIIYRLHPQSSWAPAGMYKASQLYLNLAKLSGKKVHKNQASDLLSRLKNKYPKSAYAGRARTLLKSINIKPRPPAKKS